MIYLDYAATTPLRPAAKSAMVTALEAFGNPSSVHRAGQLARRVVDDARRSIADALGVRAERVVFTSGATEANNLALRGVMQQQKGKVLLIGATEHDCVRVTAQALLESGVCGVEMIPCDTNGVTDLDWLAQRLNKGDVGLVSLMHANNETGVIQPVKEAAALAHAHGVLMHSDAVQTVGHMAVEMDALGLDLMSLTAHKFGGPKGAGALVVKPEVKMAAHITGGGQERNRRAGTENVVGIAGMAAALSDALEHLTEETQQAEAMAMALAQGLPAGMRIVGGDAAKVPHVRMVATPNQMGDMLVMKADVAGVCISQGSACSSGRVVPSHVLLAMGFDDKAALQAVRLSWGWGSTPADLEKALGVLAA